MSEWTDWKKFPDPSKKEYLNAPIGPGVYELYHCDGKKVLFGQGKNVAYRMSSLLPPPLGCGTRNNGEKRQYVLDHLPDIVYRTLACVSIEEARQEEQRLQEVGGFRFGTRRQRGDEEAISLIPH